MPTEVTIERKVVTVTPTDSAVTVTVESRPVTVDVGVNVMSVASSPVFPTTRVTDDDVVVGDVLTVNATTGQWKLAVSTLASGLWEVAGVSTVAVSAGSGAAAETLHGRTVATRFASAPSALANGSYVYLSSTPGVATLTPPADTSIDARIVVGILVGADGSTLFPPVQLAPDPYALTVATTDEFAGVTATDTTPGYLDAKIVGGTGISTAVLNPGANEDLEISLAAHASTHENGGADEISVLGLSGLLADPQTPLAHAASHADGGADEINAADLGSGAAGAGNVLTADGAGGNAYSVVATTDKFAGVTAADTTPGYLGAKIVGGTGISIAVLNPGADEDLEVSLATHASTHENGGADTIDHSAMVGLVGGNDHPQYGPIENGFEDGEATTARASTSLSYLDGTRTLTLTRLADYTVVSEGVRLTITTNKSATNPDVEGVHFFYLDGTGTLQTTASFSVDLIAKYAFVAAIYWDATNNTAIRLMDERHGLTMDAATHRYLHLTAGARYATGLSPGNVIADGSGALDTHAQLSIANGTIWDEDLEHTITDDSPQDLSPIAQLPVFYRSGAAGDWRQLAATNFPVTTTGTGRAAWNEDTGATWQLTEVANNQFALSHIFATGDVTEPVVVIVGQASYGNLSAAREGAATEIVALQFGQIEGLTAEIVPVATVIFQTSNSYGNAVKSRIRTTDMGDDWIDWREQASPVGAASGVSNWVELLDTPASITANEFVRGDGTGAALEQFDLFGTANSWSAEQTIQELVVGTAGLRFKGTTGAPGTPQNGDVWIDSTFVYLRSDAANWKFEPSAAWTVTNGTTDRAFDANATTIDELADVVATMIADLQNFGALG